jgi:Polyketide cyclase / dehydrase and lipid transport
MAQYRTTIESTWSPQEAFEYLSDFGNTRHWDPSVTRTRKLGDDPVGYGSAFLVVTRFQGREVELQYRITEYQPGQRVVMTAETPRLRSVDEITFEPAGASSGTRVTYNAALTLKGPYRLADPLLQRAFNRLGDAAAAGLERELNR